MNEQRIREIANQASDHAENTVEYFPDTEDGLDYPAKMMKVRDLKFAELIVQECIAQIRPMWNQVKEVGVPPGYDYDTFDLAYNDCMNAIKEHFGVEDRAIPILSADEQALFAGITSSRLFTIAGAKKHFGVKK
jgi:hypothetical protein